MIKILIVPSSDDEHFFEECADFKAAEKKYMRGKPDSVRMFKFTTVEEARAFIKGYEVGIGYLGEGLWFSNTKF